MSHLKPISKSTLLGLRSKGGWSPYFNFAQIHIGSLIRRNSVITYYGRYPKLNTFLEHNKNKIKVFADIGPGSAIGAPTTMEAKKILGENSIVFAVDIYKPSIDLTRYGITPLHQAIQAKPLSVKCDAIRFANVSPYMTREKLEKALDNIWQSLKLGGFLLGANEMTHESREFIADKEHQFVLVKVRKTKSNPHGFVELKDIEKPSPTRRPRK